MQHYTSFGPTPDEIGRVASTGYAAWIDQQFAAPASSHLAFYNGTRNPAPRQTAWWTIAVRGHDQLRQRVAFALSEIFVVSELGPGLNENQQGLAYYYDLLVNNAFGRFRTLLEVVTLSPEMGRYLSMLGNPKPDPSAGTRSDENFAREVMQLFTIGTVQLELDGSVRRDAIGKPMTTYTQEDIVNLARALTGWTWSGATDFRNGPPNWTTQMRVFRTGSDEPGNFHDAGAKTLVGGVLLPAGQSAEADLDMALDVLAGHPNVAPFISRQLIQRLVTSNPTHDYVRRVASVFNSSDGNLGAVVRAILLDPEARLGAEYLGTRFGKVREPLLRLTQLWRAFGANTPIFGRAPSGPMAGVPEVPAILGEIEFSNAHAVLDQSPLRSSSVFNFFPPTYEPPYAARGLQGDPCAPLAPELQLANESSVPRADNALAGAVALHEGPNSAGYSGTHNVRISIGTTAALAANPSPDALLDQLDELITGGRMSEGLRNEVVARLDATRGAPNDIRAVEAIYLVLTSPENLIQR